MYLINRTPPARAICLQSLTRNLIRTHGNTDFSLKDLYYSDEHSVLDFCELAKRNPRNPNTCPYIENPLDGAGCYLTKSHDSDSTKEKEISNTANSLDALGFVERDDRKLRIRQEGIDFASAEFDSADFFRIFRNAVLGYGCAVGVFWKYSKQGEIYNSRDALIGYPRTEEYATLGNGRVRLSTGSQEDSLTRTRSCILAWLTTVGSILPKGIVMDPGEYPQVKTASYINNKNRNLTKYELIEYPSLLNEHYVIPRPLDYNNLIKSIRSLRERGSKETREGSIKFESIVKDRRLAILIFLNHAFNKGRAISITSLVDFLMEQRQYFFANTKILSSEALSITKSELLIAPSTGLLISQNSNKVIPYTGINESIMKLKAPKDILATINDACAGVLM